MPGGTNQDVALTKGGAAVRVAAMNSIVLEAADLDGYLTEKDRRTITAVDAKYAEAMQIFP